MSTGGCAEGGHLSLRCRHANGAGKEVGMSPWALRVLRGLVLLIPFAIGLFPNHNVWAIQAENLEARIASLPLSFIPNAGQLPEDAIFMVKDRAYTVLFGSRGVTFVVHGGRGSAVVQLRFLGANEGVLVEGLDDAEEIDLGGGSTIPLVLNVKQIYVKDECITDKEKISIEFSPIARIGKSYARLGDEINPPKIP